MRFGTPSRICAIAGLLCSSALIATAGPAGAVSPPYSPWTQTDYNAAKSRANVQDSTLTPATVNELAFQRVVRAGRPPVDAYCANAVISEPALVGGYVYAIAIGRLIKWTAATGHVVWRRVLDPYFTTVYSSLSVSAGLVVVGGEDCVSQSDPNGVLQAFSAQSGAPAWSANTSPLGGALSDLVVSGGYVVVIGQSVGSGTEVAVHRLFSGAPVWNHAFGNLCGVSDRVAVVGGRVIYVGCSEATNTPFLAGDQLATGKRMWTIAGDWHPDAGDTDAANARDLYATNSSGTVTDIVAQTGTVRGTLSGAKDVLAVGPWRVFTTCNSGGSVCAYWRSTRVRTWRVDTRLSQPMAATAGGVLLLGNGSALGARSGARLATLWSGSASAIIVAGGGIGVVKAPGLLDLYS
ncbi:MAG: PQQ-like beta-propeller repeat protein [Actinomycetota bacterium]|nr:PQQ-like beta-propeller repeat protein [Actinomycetota bacterium]